MPFFVHRSNDPQPTGTRIDGDSLLIGRGTNADLRLDEPTVALEHARIERLRAGYRLTDLGSVTGTYLNGKPVQKDFLSDGDTVDVGAYRLRVRRSAPADHLSLEVEPLAAAAATGPAAVPVREVDYLRAYGLRRPFFTKGCLALVLTLATAAGLASLPRFGAWEAFQPGPTIVAHQRAAVGCLDCHAPWEGPKTVSCKECHGRAEHQASQAVDPDCASCHFEHRGQDLVLQVTDASCTSCHGDLALKPGATPVFASTITTFPEGHPDFSVTLPGGARMRLAQAVKGAADPGTVRLNHALHLRPGLIGPEGREALSCASCHQPGSGPLAPTGMRPVSYAQHCNRCHRLTFDDARPDEEVPHAEPRAVHDRLVAAYGVDEERMETFRERRRSVLRNPREAMGVSLSARVLAQLSEAEAHLYRSACATCHVMDLAAKPHPTVARRNTQDRWLPISHFDHAQHLETRIRGLTCETCHARAVSSTTSADVLLPGIEACGGCHGGGGRPPGNAELTPGRSQCVQCHSYHPAKGESAG